MTIDQISNRLITLLENKAFIEAQEALFDENVISEEPSFHPKPITKGLQKLLHKEQQYIDSIASWEAFELSGPVIAKNHFSIKMYSKLRLKTGQLVEIDEIILYEVAHGKIVKESFFYSKP